MSCGIRQRKNRNKNTYRFFSTSHIKGSWSICLCNSVCPIVCSLCNGKNSLFRQLLLAAATAGYDWHCFLSLAIWLAVVQLSHTCEHRDLLRWDHRHGMREMTEKWSILKKIDVLNLNYWIKYQVGVMSESSPKLLVIKVHFKSKSLKNNCSQVSSHKIQVRLKSKLCD